MSLTFREIYCTGCKEKVNARLTNGEEVYAHRTDLYELPFWKCDKCTNFVGCHHKTKDRERPLGIIPTAELKKARIKIHQLIDPLWKEKIVKRKRLYEMISDVVGWNYHTANIRDIDEARTVYRAALKIKQELTND